jgi:prevent-host-death family protein
MQKIIGLKELRENLQKYENAVQKGNSFIIMKRSKPIFKITPIDDDKDWETLIDFTKIKKGGVDIDDILSRL